MEQSPCPDRIIDDCGGAFSMGLVGGSVFHLVRGMRHSPVGGRLRGGFNSVTLRAPILGGNFAVWGCLFSTFDCTYAYYRHREDSWNAILSGATTGGILACRAGWKAMARNAAVGGVLLALIEGMSVLAQKSMGGQQAPPPVMAPPQYELEGHYGDKDKENKWKDASENRDEEMLVEDMSLFDEFDDGFEDSFEEK